MSIVPLSKYILPTLLLCLMLIIGCRKTIPDEVVQIQQDLEATTPKKESANEVFRYIPQMIHFERRAAVREVVYHLNAWRNALGPDDRWKKTQLLSTLPPDAQKSPWAERIDLPVFEESECDYLFQCWMMNQTASWVTRQPYRDGLFARWLEKQKESVAPEDFSRLETAMKLFDWTIRNIYAEGNPKEIESLIPNPSLPYSDTGKGYTQLPWQTMMMARGDALARARVFSQLCFQESIPVIWLALPGGTELKLWLMGIPVGGELYLFEPRMGIPLPGPGQVGIATLRQAQSDESVLRRARVPGFFEYGMTFDQVKQVIGLVDLDPMSLSRTMFLLENALTGDTRLTLSTDADAIAKEVSRCCPDLKLRLWGLPWMNYEYSRQLRERLKQPNPTIPPFLRKLIIFMDDNVVSRARMAHLAGKFENTISEAGALGMYMQLRVDDATLDKMLTDQDVQKSLAVRRNLGEDYNVFEQRVIRTQEVIRESKFFSSIFIAMLQFDLANFESCRSWADKRTLQFRGTEYFHPICWYLIGRSLEQLGQTAEALDWYRKGPSSQEAGNRIRVRLLGQSGDSGN